MSELNLSQTKSCPFCEGTRLTLQRTVVCWVRCETPDCGAEGPVRGTETEAIAAWNTRSSVERLVEALKPFAEKAERWPTTETEDAFGKRRSDGFTVSVSLGACRKASAAISASRTGSDGGGNG